MPDYTTVEQCITILPAINSISNVMSETICEFIQQAESLVNAKISKVYSVPVEGTPPLLATISADIAIYRLLTRRVFTQDRSNKSDWPDRYKEALDQLDLIASGELAIITTSGTVVSAASNNAPFWSNTQGFSATFNEDDEIYSSVSETKLDDIESRKN